MPATVPRCQPKDTAARQHSPLPWIAKGQAIRESSKHAVSVAYCGTTYGAGVGKNGKVESFSIDDDEAVANAAFIVEAVNSHASLKARIQELTEALQFIADGYDNHDVNHVDYRVRVYQVALEALSAAGNGEVGK